MIKKGLKVRVLTGKDKKKEGEVIHFDNQERHRLVGLDKIGVVAEIWIHTDLNNPSDENDIVRISDDYKRT